MADGAGALPPDRARRGAPAWPPLPRSAARPVGVRPRARARDGGHRARPFPERQDDKMTSNKITANLNTDGRLGAYYELAEPVQPARADRPLLQRVLVRNT